MSATASPAGMKRICTGCGNRFYDLNKRPIVCPACSVEFTGEIKIKSRRGRDAIEDTKEGQVSEATANENEEDILDEEDDLEVVSLEDVEEMEDEDEDDEAMTLDDEDDLDDIPEFDDDLDGDLDEDEEEDSAILDDED